MKKEILRFLLVILLVSSISSSSAYFFATDVETKVVALENQEIELLVTQHDDKTEAEVYPIGTILKGRFFEYNFKRHFLRDEYMKIHLYEAVLPNGTVQKINNDIKVRPRVVFNTKHSLQLLGAGLGTALKVTVAVWSVGFPVGRGVKAVTDAAFGVYNTPVKESKWKQGTKGFVKGALFPLPELVMKGEEVPLHDESFLWIQDADADEKKLTAFLIKRKNIYLSREKYYRDKGTEGPDFTQFLKDDDMKKYQEKLARRKGVSAKVQEKQVEFEEKENMVQNPSEQNDLEELQEDSKVQEANYQTEAPSKPVVSILEKENTNEEDIKSAIEFKEQDLTIKPHTHIWQRSWRKPKVTFEQAQ